jgi:putative DNA primase/helicase
VIRAASIAAALGGRREGANWRCVCPVHGGRSLSLSDGRGGRLLAYCHCGCDFLDIIAELRDRGLLDGSGDGIRDDPDDRDFDREAAIRRQRFMAAKIWAAAIPGERSPQLKRYLLSRGITVSPPASLRWAAQVWHSTTRQTGIEYPAMISKVVNVDGELIAIHKTYLVTDGSEKICGIQDKECLAPVAGGAVRLAQFDPERPLIIGEGIENTMSLMQLRGLPGWSGLSAAGIRVLVLPRTVQRVLIGVDNDRNGVGQAAARDAAWRWQEEGRDVRVALPPLGCDFNDVLAGNG